MKIKTWFKIKILKYNNNNKSFDNLKINQIKKIKQ